MRTFALLLLPAFSFAQPAKPTIEGEWKVVNVEGNASLKENVTKITIDAETITAGRAAKYSIDPAKGTIDMAIDAGPVIEQGKYLGVYELKGNELKLHFAAVGKPRPAGMKREEGSFIISLKK